MPFDSNQTVNLDAHQLRQAQDLIADPRLWLQGRFTDQLPDGRLRQCTFAALHQTVTGVPFIPLLSSASIRDEQRIQALAGQLVAAAPPRGKSYDDVETDLCAMNNRLTHQELMATFARAIATAEAQNLPV